LDVVGTESSQVRGLAAREQWANCSFGTGGDDVHPIYVDDSDSDVNGSDNNSRNSSALGFTPVNSKIRRLDVSLVPALRTEAHRPVVNRNEWFHQHPPRFCGKSFLGGGQNFSLEFSGGG
jgi:hypothetical protein